MSIQSEYAAFLKRVESAVEDSLKNEVAEEAKEVLREKVYSEVYEKYTPIFESRRMDDGGLSDIRNMDSWVAEGDTLYVQDAAPLQNLWGGNDTSPLAPIVGEGLPKYNMPFPRPFHSVAENELVNGGKAEKALARGLKRNGI